MPVLPKLSDRLIAAQDFRYVAECKILSDVQSGFVAGRSTSSALVKITDDMICATDRRQLAALLLFDFSKTFDTILHGVLCAKLQYLFD